MKSEKRREKSEERKVIVYSKLSLRELVNSI